MAARESYISLFMPSSILDAKYTRQADYEEMPNTLFVTLGQRIRKLRERKGMSITEFSAHLGISRQHLSGVEHGKTEVGLVNLQAIADELGTSMSALLKGL
jgi:DNA-binding transcriptional regulator YiaG